LTHGFPQNTGGKPAGRALDFHTMNAAQIDEFRQLLLDERERIFTEMEKHGNDAVDGSDWNLRDPEEFAVRLSSGKVDQRIAADDLNLLRKVDFALLRLDEGTYEQCERCGTTIPIERLRAKPSVSLCLACQELKHAAKF
jgi:DnaK suppressor protein